MKTGKLYFCLDRKENPYNDDSAFEIWGQIQLLHEVDKCIERVLDWEWNILEIKSWFDENKELISSKPLDVLNDENKSIAELRDIAFDRDFFLAK